MKALLIYLLVINMIGIALFGIDKAKAVKTAWRIPEHILFLIAIFGGSIGCIMGMQMYRHKTKHMSFVIGMPLILIVQVCIVVALWHKGFLPL